MKLKYIVTIEVDKYEFENGYEALRFAEFAILNHKPGTYRKEIDVYMNIVKVETDEEHVAEEDANEVSEL